MKEGNRQYTPLSTIPRMPVLRPLKDGTARLTSIPQVRIIQDGRELEGARSQGLGKADTSEHLV
jgi:hypothetical protein